MQLYLQPEGLSPIPHPGSRPLAGGTYFFDRCRLWVRQPHLQSIGTFELGRLEAYRDGAPAEMQLQIYERSAIGKGLDRILAPRAGWFGGRWSFSQVKLMGVLNVTPDSFSDGGRYAHIEDAIAQGLHLLEAGADIIDVGGESTRPGALPVSSEEECRRVLPVIRNLAERGALISIDSRHAEVMEAAIAAGAQVINDVTALAGDSSSLAIAAKSGCPVILMHMQGEPRHMQDLPIYERAPFDIYDYLDARIRLCEAAGIPRDRLAIDPGIGFGKALSHNLDILANLSVFHGLGVPVMVGVSRKRMIAELSAGEPPSARLPGSLIIASHAAGQGAQIIRVHDVAETRQALKVTSALAETSAAVAAAPVPLSL